MTVTSLVNKVREQGDGIVVDFDFAFPIFNASELEVYKVVRATDVTTLKTITTDYTVSINTVTEGGTVTFVVAPSATQDSFIKRVMPLTQTSAIPTESNFPETAVENEFDKSRMIDIQLQEQIDRSSLLPIASEETPATVAGYSDRGDASNSDFLVSDLIIDAAWHDLDLSSIIAVGASAVALRVSVRGSVAGEYIRFRKNGNTQDNNASFARTQVANIIFNADKVIALDGDRKIEYYISDATIDLVNLVVKGWWG